jgi:hypothetical protein
VSVALCAMEPLGGFANVGVPELARLTRSSVRSARRWIRDGLAPRLVMWCLRIMFDAPLGEISHEWDGWHLRKGKLESPEGHAYTPHEVRAIALRMQHVAALERELATLAKSPALGARRESSPLSHDERPASLTFSLPPSSPVPPLRPSTPETPARLPPQPLRAPPVRPTVCASDSRV